MTICGVWLRRSAGTRPVKLREREGRASPSGRPRSYHPLGISRRVTVSAFCAVLCDRSVRYKNDARDPLHICRPTKLGSLPMLLQCSRLGGMCSDKSRTWVAYESSEDDVHDR